MAQILVRGIEGDVKERLQRRASRHGHSMEAEVRDRALSRTTPMSPSLKPAGASASISRVNFTWFLGSVEVPGRQR